MSLQLIPVTGLPLVEPGDDLAALLVGALARNGLNLQAGDVLVLAQKIVSKAENRYRYLDTVTVTDEAARLAADVGKPAALVQVILDESAQVLRYRRGGVLIVEHRLGFIQANAGVDRSNVSTVDGRERVLLLPENPDASAAALRRQLQQRTGVAPAVLINDSAGRPWRNGITSFAIGLSGFQPVRDCIGQPDLFGRPLEVTQVAVADELACAASLLMGQGDEAVPAVLVRGLSLPVDEQATARALLRPPVQDLFR